MLRRAAAAAVVLAGSLAPVAVAEKADPQPPAENLAWDGKTPKDGAIYRVWCEGGGRVGVTFVPNGAASPAAPTIDPELVARRVADAMKLTGPKVASPRAAGKYVVGMPMRMWATRSTSSSYGPATAKATAGGITVTATAKVAAIRWDMGDGTTVTCNGPGTPYSADRGKSTSPDCGHRYVRSAADQPDGCYKGTATATWTVTWTAALNDWSIAGRMPYARRGPRQHARPAPHHAARVGETPVGRATGARHLPPCWSWRRGAPV
ncbi:hypothetical protein [Streptomyces sp. NPDC024089]|uniref:hypothetical protein n=1 Tax=Streptomyces sp. NPDC024089 TaxID=3154328 RepID=UPI0033CDCBF5